MIDWLQLNFVALLNVIIIDVVLAGDNAIIVGLAASRVAPELRARVIFWGIVGAVVLRIAFAARHRPAARHRRAHARRRHPAAVGVLEDVPGAHSRRAEGRRRARRAPETAPAAAPPMSFRAAVTQIILADVSMSLDNVLAVAGAAKGSPAVLVIGLGVAIVLMAVAANYIANLLAPLPLDRLDRPA